ncbi:MAG: peptide chain release factor N(5)-glutamine methyltransferase [Bacteroidales bacterium]|nr:peptide chain release factor N(5)-glutamine methyltransferase [Bacteroidales bacterium]MCB8998573.1 peptide chain release factor N(5)-glutamine methyltransferase [Bacteroidales bacterium]MCB9012559.1 peptide chain release factor N(5)-glutamine methyltransferase [Bacteroidales bacterium]
MKVKEAIRYIIDSASGIYSPGEAESIAFIFLDFIGFSRKEIFTLSEEELGSANEHFLHSAVTDLKSFKPVQYILGETEFYGLKFRLNENVLIPRQETEELVQKIVRDTKNDSPGILDLGTGSGCIAISLKKFIPSAKVYAIDISPAAIEIAEFNAKLNETEITFLESDMHEGLNSLNQEFDIVVSNPPYVREMEKAFMHPNVLEFEPATALFVKDDDPLEFYRAICDICKKNLAAGGRVYVEINEALGMEVAELFRSYGMVNIEIIPDINEKNRFVKASKKIS